MIKSISLLAAVLTAGTCALPYPLTQTCPAPSSIGGAQATIGGKPYSGCLPSWCFTSNVVDASTQACSFDAISCDYALAVKNIGCKQCTQSTQPKCSTANLTAAIMGTTVKAAYCNDQFLVVHSSGRGDFAGNLEEVPFPPGGTTTWATACRTRSQTDGYYVHKIPLSYSLLSTSQGSNNVGAFTAAGATYLINSASGAVYGLAADGPVAISANGQEHYPVYNNNAQITAEKCEVDSCNQHVGQGGGPAHLHGDPFGTYCMYSNASYVDSVNGHPPQTGWSFDGPSIYGRYLSTTALGQSVPLDDCGGHAHGSYEYHYHAQVTTETTSSGIPSNFGVAAGQSYPSFSGGVYKCYKADISVGAQPYFFVSDKTNQALYQPCCSGTQKYVAAGITLATTASSPQPAPSGCSASKTLAAWLITVIVVSSVVFVALVAFAVWWFKFRVASDSVVDASVSGNDMEMSEKRQETA